MLQQQVATLTATFSEVLANLAFMFTSLEPAEGGDGPWLECVIGYNGPKSGRLRLRCTQGFARMLAANLLGLDPDEEEAARKSNDAVKELMNVMCGQFVTTMYGSDGVFNLTIPSTAELPEPPDLTQNDGTRAASLPVDGFPVQIVHESTGAAR